jgi:cell division protein FtsI (penicillin-binding protein 3)
VIRFRLYILAALLFLGFVGVLFRAFQLQVFPTEKLESLARRQMSKTLEVAGRRGLILDRNGQELAVSVNTVSIFANPQQVRQIGETARALAPLLGLSESVLAQKLREPKKKFVWLARQVPSETAQKLEAIDARMYPGVGMISEFRREYPMGKLASHVLGFTSPDGVGVEGLESRLESELSGGRSEISFKKDARGRPLFLTSDVIRLESEHGRDVTLSLDTRLQFAVEQALREAVEKHEAVGGTAIVMNPHNGEVLALANEPSGGRSSRNMAITDPIEPGSVLKPFVVGRALEDRVVNPKSIISGGNGFIRVGGKVIGEADAKHRVESMTIQDLIRKSSNVGTVFLQQKMGWPRIDDTFRKLGFGQLTGIELGGESRGIFRSPEPRQVLEQATMSFGQGIALTPLQVTAAYAVIANGGRVIQPSILKGGHSPGLRVFSEETAKQLRFLLEKVVEDEGTGVQAKIESFPVAGKTGTAQRVDFERGGYESGAYWASFVGMVPSRSPRYVIYTMVDRPHVGGYYGGVVAAPIFSKIAKAALRLVVPQHQIAVQSVQRVGQKKSPERNQNKIRNLITSHQVPDLVGLSLSRAMALMKDRSLKLEISTEFSGEGTRVSGQVPEAGAPIPDDRRVRLQLR